MNALAMSSLPVPVSPKMRTGESVVATDSTWLSACLRLRPVPIIASRSRFWGSRATPHRAVAKRQSQPRESLPTLRQTTCSGREQYRK